MADSPPSKLPKLEVRTNGRDENARCAASLLGNKADGALPCRDLIAVSLQTNLIDAAGLNERFLAKADCWLNIFNFLHYGARFRCEFACKSIRELMVDQLWISEHSFDARLLPDSRSYFERCREEYPSEKRRRALSAAVVEICTRIGDSLKVLVLRGAYLDRMQFETICKSCPNILLLDVGYGGAPYDWRFETFAKLNEFRASGSLSVEELLSLPASLQVLRELSVRSTEAKGSFFIDSLRDFLRAHPALLELAIDRSEYAAWGSRIESVDLFRLVVENAPQIRRLDITASELVLDSFSQLSSMESVKLRTLSKHSLTDKVVVEFCQRNTTSLRSLSFDDENCWWSLGLDAFRALGTLRALKEFRLAGEWLTGFVPGLSLPVQRDTRDHDKLLRPVVEQCGATLCALDFRWLKITDSSIDCIIACCPRLRSLRLRWCHRVSTAALRRLIDAVAASPRGELRIDVVVKTSLISPGEKELVYRLEEASSAVLLSVDIDDDVYMRQLSDADI